MKLKHYTFTIINFYIIIQVATGLTGCKSNNKPANNIQITNEPDTCYSMVSPPPPPLSLQVFEQQTAHFLTLLQQQNIDSAWQVSTPEALPALLNWNISNIDTFEIVQFNIDNKTFTDANVQTIINKVDSGRVFKFFWNKKINQWIFKGMSKQVKS